MMKSYNERLQEYEKEKAKLRMQPLTEVEYEREIKKLADKYRI